jgi:signal transduction histidine kinase
MKIRLLLIAGENERFVAAANEAAGSAFPGSEVARAASLAEALEMARPTVAELLLLEEPSAAQLADAAKALDDQHLPRWAVVASGALPPPPFAEVVPAGEWTPAVLARVFRSSIALHLLRRDRERLLGDLLTVGIRVTHDLRTPLGGIISATEALDELQGRGPGTERSLTQPIVESAQELVKIISQLTTLAKATAKPDLRQAFNMGTPAARAMERLEARTLQAGATVSKPPSWPDVTGDPAKVETVWQFLLENALRHAGKQPKIELGWEQTTGGYKFWVRDNGAGVPPEKRRLLFQPFHRLHEPNAGRGIGLSIVERLVHLQGGHCGYEPLAQGGSCFFFTLPGSPAG